MSVLLLVLLLLLIAINGFFVAAEFALVRLARGTARAARRGGRIAAPTRRSSSSTRSTSPRRLPGRDHARLDRHRLPRRAGDREAARADLRRACSRRRSRSAISLAIAFIIVTFAPHHRRRAGAEDARDRQRRARRPPGRAAAAAGSGSRPRPFTIALTRRLQRASSGSSASTPSDLEEQHTAEDLRADHRQLGQPAATLDPGEAGMLGGVFHLHEQEAREVMTPIPAVVTVDADETVEDGAAALRHLRPHPPGRDRGRQPRPGHAASSTTTASPGST